MFKYAKWRSVFNLYSINLMKVVFILAFLFNISFVYSQLVKDSLLLQIKTHKSALLQAKIMGQLADEYLNISLDSATYYAKASLLISKRLSLKKEQAKAYEVFGKIEYMKNDTILALTYFNLSLKIRQAIKDSNGIGFSYETLGLLSYKKGDYTKSLSYQQSALSIFKKTKDAKGLSKVYNNIGLIYLGIGQYEQAIIYYQQALQLKKNAGDLKGVGIALNQLGNIYLYWGKSGKAIINYQQALAIFEKISFRKGIASCLTNIGLVNETLKQYNQAIDNYKRALSVEKEIGNKLGIANSLTNMGNVYIARNEIAEALACFKEALVFRKEQNDLPGIATSLHNIGYVYGLKKEWDLSNSYYREALRINQKIENQAGICTDLSALGSNCRNKKDFNQAIIYLKQSLALASKMSLAEMKRNNYELLSDVYYDTQEYKKSCDYYRAYKAVYDSLFSYENNKQIAEIQTRFETEKKQRKIEELNKEQARKDLELSRKQYKIATQRTIFFIIIGIVLIGFLIFYLYYRHRQIQKSNKLQYELDKTMFSALGRQMNPHFIYNALNSIQYFILQNDEIASNKYLTMFARLIRMSLNNSRQQIIPIRDEIEALGLYLELESLRFKNKFEYNIQVDPNIDKDKHKIPSLLVQPFIENAIWHGLMHIDVKGLLSISFIRNNDSIICRIQDNGIGRELSAKINSQKRANHKSLGIYITRSRIDLINKLYGKNMLIQIIDLKDNDGKPQGTLVEISFPVIETLNI